MTDPGCTRPGDAGYLRLAVTLGLTLAFLALVVAAGCGNNMAADLSPNQVLERSVQDMLSWKSYRYTGTSELVVATDARLNSKASFTTDLVQNAAGALDGHMVVDSPGSSYETFTRDGVEYTRLEGSDWTSKALAGEGAGMVSAESRRIIASFADLVDDTRFEGKTGESYTVAFTMGERYKNGAAAIAGSAGGEADASVPGLAMQAGGWHTIYMKLTVDRKTLRAKGVWTRSSTAATKDLPAVATVTEGTFSRVNQPVSIEPPPEAE